MKRLLASGTILMMVLVHFSNITMFTKIYHSSPDTSTNILKITTYLDGSLLAESTGEIIANDPYRPEMNGTLTFTEDNDVILIEQHVSILQLTDFPYISLDGSAFFEGKSLNGRIDVTPKFGLPLENSALDFSLNETMIHLNASGTVLYEKFLTYDPIDNETIKDAIDELNNSGFNQSNINSTVYNPTGGKVECTEFSINVVNGTTSADITFSMTLSGDIYLGFILTILNLTGQSFPSAELQSIISEVIDDALDLVTNSTINLSYSTEGLLVIDVSTFLIDTFDDDLQLLKNKILANFLGGIDGFTFLHLTDVYLEDVALSFNCDSEQFSWSVNGLYMDPPVDIINATDFDIPGLFDGLSNIDPFFDNITLIMEGGRNATHAVIVVVPQGVPQPGESDSAIWVNVSLGDLEGVWFRIVSIPPEFWMFSYNALLWFATLSSVVSFVVVLSAMYRRRFFNHSTVAHNTEVK